MGNLVPRALSSTICKMADGREKRSSPDDPPFWKSSRRTPWGRGWRYVLDFTYDEPPPLHVSKRSAASALATSNFKLFQGTTPPDPPRLACPFGPPFNLHHMFCFIAQLWKLLLRTLIRHRDHKDQETAPWRLHCTLTIVTLKWYFHMTATKFMKIDEGDRFNKKIFKGA